MEKKTYSEPTIKVRVISQTLLAGSLSAKDQQGTVQLSKDGDNGIQWDNYLNED